MHTLLGLYYKDASLLKLFLVVLGIIISNMSILFHTVYSCKNQNPLNKCKDSKDCRDATLSISYLIGIIMQSLK